MNSEVDQGLLKWFSQQRAQNITINSAILQSKAEELDRKLFKAEESKINRSWIERFKKRHNISSGKIVGECKAVDMNCVQDWLQNKWPIIRRNFNDEDIFNGDETGLFYKLTPDRTLRFKGEKCEGGKLSKERITVLIVANLLGTEKRKLLVIGKSRNPRCFKNVMQLPVNYTSNKKAWMTSEIFESELRKWNNELRYENRKIILLVDNCPAHPDVKNLDCIKLVFMPPNTSSKLQPMDQGVIHSLKSHYRHLILSKMIEYIDSGRENFSINLLDAIHFLHLSWQKVSGQTIANCFRHGGFLKNGDNFDSEDDLPLVEWLKKNQQEENNDSNMQDKDFQEFVHIDDQLVTVEYLDDDAIVASVSSVDDEQEDQEDENENSVDGECISVPTSSEALKYIDSVRHFLQSRNTPQYVHDRLAEVELYINDIHFTKTKQTKINDFFKVNS